MAYVIDSPRPWFAAKLRYAVSNDDVIPALTGAGGAEIPAGTLEEVLQAILDLADPAA